MYCSCFHVYLHVRELAENDFPEAIGESLVTVTYLHRIPICKRKHPEDSFIKRNA